MWEKDDQRLISVTASLKVFKLMPLPGPMFNIKITTLKV